MSNRVLTELLHGNGAHADPIACVEDLPFELAAQSVEGFPHSIGQLVFHMNYWMDYELRRIHDERPPFPKHNSESFPLGPSPADAQDWDLLRRNFAGLLAGFAALANSSPHKMRRQIVSLHAGEKKLAATLEAVISQMVAHNSYHTGQIAMIRRALDVWPPRGGGDTW